MEMVPGKLLLETGESFDGQIPTFLQTPCLGEVVFNTGMVGYVESLTDPSYSGQILVFTYPLIGNYGVTAHPSWESHKIHAKGVIVSEMAAHFSNHGAQQSLATWLETQNIPYLTGVDTRALTKRLRTRGVIPGAIVHHNATLPEFENFDAQHWVSNVSINEPQYYGEGEKQVIVVDCGMKENILRYLLDLPIRIKRVPHDYDYSDEDFDGVFVSNGPGDPVHCKETVRVLQKAFTKKKPIFGICLGTQILALAVGAKTFKLPFGHRSHNQPCMDLSTQKCYLTSQNHSYAVDETSLPDDWRVSFRNLNDQSIEGIEHKELPFFAVQFHPEAAPGPCDTVWLFQKFYNNLMAG